MSDRLGYYDESIEELEAALVGEKVAIPALVLVDYIARATPRLPRGYVVELVAACVEAQRPAPPLSRRIAPGLR